MLTLKPIYLAILALCFCLCFSAPVLEQEPVSGAESANLTLEASAVRQDGFCSSGTTHYVSLAVAYDNSFCALYGGTMEAADAVVRSRVQQANEVFQTSTCIQLVLTYLEPHCNDPADPYASIASIGSFGTSAAGPEILNDFRGIWEASRTSVVRDVAFLFGGFEDGTSTAGYAGYNNVCNSFGYGWVEGDSDSLFIHEMGHTLGGTHTTEGVMQSTVFEDQLFLSAFSANEIINFVDNSAACISTSSLASV